MLVMYAEVSYKANDSEVSVNKVDLSLEILKTVASNSNFKDLPHDEKINQLLQAYKKIYRDILQRNSIAEDDDNGGPKSGKVIAAILQIVASNNTNTSSLDFSSQTDELLKQFQQISTKLAEMEL